jgi:hypothetical protein
MTSGDVHRPTVRPGAPPESTALGSIRRIDFRVANMGRSIERSGRGRDEPGPDAVQVTTAFNIRALGRLELLQSETTSEIDALLPALLDRAFKGQL